MVVSAPKDAQLLTRKASKQIKTRTEQTPSFPERIKKANRTAISYASASALASKGAVLRRAATGLLHFGAE
ncbi:hypothetical protein [Croceibacterium ferulae]|uniref:hypothetical protein n=1 Tax=Croceibacterium ferulae TaxID=1854641 RepID=UPI0013901034|nr:hypothetical protein [Croceibacterium ferulae]